MNRTQEYYIFKTEADLPDPSKGDRLYVLVKDTNTIYTPKEVEGTLKWVIESKLNEEDNRIPQ
jgi:hypothetical protein